MSTNELRTHDLYYAAYLYASGVQLADVVAEGARIVFAFDLRGSSASDLEASWATGKGTVSGFVYANALKSLKDALFLAKTI